jgi:hypothetical protein
MSLLGFFLCNQDFVFLAVGNLGLIQMMMTRKKKDITLPDFNIKKTKHTTPGTWNYKKRGPQYYSNGTWFIFHKHGVVFGILCPTVDFQ